MGDPMTLQAVEPLTFKPDMEGAARRWDAFYAGEIVDRPIVCVCAPSDGKQPVRGSSYRERAYGDMDDILARTLLAAEATYYGGEAIPTFWLSFGPDEVAVFCGAELGWSDGSGDTNWSRPFVSDWETAPPLALQEEHPLWQRMLEFCRRASDQLAGKMLVSAVDLHTNMDLVAAVRGPQRLCVDLVEQPEAIDRAVIQARQVFRKVWDGVRLAARMDEHGYCSTIYSKEGAAFLQCDFCCMISPPMFRRWVLPALEEEASIVRHSVYHWDGPGALVHTDDLVNSSLITTLSYVPGDGHGSHVDFIPMLRSLQDRGKAVHVWGSIDEIKILHRELRPEKVIYCTNASTRTEADAFLRWMVVNT